jgi:hypothetical protein
LPKRSRLACYLKLLAWSATATGSLREQQSSSSGKGRTYSSQAAVKRNSTRVSCAVRPAPPKTKPSDGDTVKVMHDGAAEEDLAFILLKDQTQTNSVVNVLTTSANETTLNIAQILSGDSLKLLFPNPLVDPASPDIW